MGGGQKGRESGERSTSVVKTMSASEVEKAKSEQKIGSTFVWVNRREKKGRCLQRVKDRRLADEGRGLGERGKRVGSS